MHEPGEMPATCCKACQQLINLCLHPIILTETNIQWIPIVQQFDSFRQICMQEVCSFVYVCRLVTCFWDPTAMWKKNYNIIQLQTGKDSHRQSGLSNTQKLLRGGRFCLPLY